MIKIQSDGYTVDIYGRLGGILVRVSFDASLCIVLRFYKI